MQPRGGNGSAQAHYRDYGKMTYARSVSVIHNIAHQGRAPMAEMGSLEVPDSYSHLVRRRPAAAPPFQSPSPPPPPPAAPGAVPHLLGLHCFVFLSHSQNRTQAHGGLVGGRLRGAAPRGSCGPVCHPSTYLPASPLPA